MCVHCCPASDEHHKKVPRRFHSDFQRLLHLSLPEMVFPLQNLNSPNWKVLVCVADRVPHAQISEKVLCGNSIDAPHVPSFIALIVRSHLRGYTYSEYRIRACRAANREQSVVAPGALLPQNLFRFFPVDSKMATDTADGTQAEYHRIETVDTNELAFVVRLLDRTIVDQYQIEELRRELFGAVAAHSRKALLLDLAGVETMSSTFLTVLVSLNRKLKESNCALRIYNISDRVEEAFAITKLSRILCVRDSKAHALYDL